MLMFKGLRVFIRVSLLIVILVTWVLISYASNSPATTPDSISSKDIIMILLALLQTVFLGTVVWLVGNDKELFTRMGKAESKINMQEALCKERNNEGDHHHQRLSDTNPNVALKESVDLLRKVLHQMENKTDKEITE